MGGFFFVRQAWPTYPRWASSIHALFRVSSLPSVLTAIIHYQTPDLLRAAVRSFRAVYPEADLLIVDNGSKDGSEAEVLRIAAEAGGPTRTQLLPVNEFHGPAMDRVLREASSDAVFFLDSDTVTRRGDFLQPMLKAVFAADDILGAGKLVTVDRRGFAAPVGIPVPASAYMLIRRSLYLNLPPFVHHGLPVLAACAVAHRRGLRLESFPVDTYVDHLGRGTAERFGYGLGLRSRLDYLLHRLGL